MNSESNNNNTQLRRLRRYVLWVGIIGLTVFNLSGCDTCFGCYDGFDPSDLSTEILEVKISPNPAIRGDTLHLQCVIKDSLDSTFRYRWIFQTDGFADTLTTSSKLSLYIDTEADTLRAVVVVIQPTWLGSSPSRRIQIPIGE